MNKYLLSTLIMLFTGTLLLQAQSVQVKDTDNNLLLEIKDEGRTGSIFLPDSTAAPEIIFNKLYNVNGSLFFNGIKLGIPDSSSAGWNYQDTEIILSTITDNVGIGTNTPLSKLSVNGSGHAAATIYGASANSSGRAVFGEANHSTGLNYGGYFQSFSSAGRGVYGKATSGDPFVFNYGGYFESAGQKGRGVFGYASNSFGENYGGRFLAAGSEGRGVYGYASSLSSNINYGGYFECEGTMGQAVFGLAKYTGNTENYGGWFKAKGNKGRGVYGTASNVSGVNYGGYFESASGSGRGVYGRSTNTSGENYGGYFQAEGATGRAVFGLAAGTSNVNYGGWFKALGKGGRGVYGEAPDVNGINYGGYFLAKSIQGRAVFGLAEYVAGGENFGGWFKGKGDSKGTGVYAWGNKYDFYADGPGMNYASSSSRRWKNNIIEIDKPLEKVIALRGVYYNWNEEHGGRHDIGMIAEEVGKVVPEIVEYEDNGIDATAMDYSKLTPLLVEAMKELNNKVEKLAAENEKLKKEISSLKR